MTIDYGASCKCSECGVELTPINSANGLACNECDMGASDPYPQEATLPGVTGYISGELPEPELYVQVRECIETCKSLRSVTEKTNDFAQVMKHRVDEIMRRYGDLARRIEVLEKGRK